MTFIDYTARNEELQSLHTCVVLAQGFPVYLGPTVPRVNLQVLKQQLEGRGFSVSIETIRLVNMTSEYEPITVLIDAPHKLGHVNRQALRGLVRQILSFNLMEDNDHLRC